MADAKYVLTVNADGSVTKVEQLNPDGSLVNIPVLDFFSKVTFPDSASVTIRPMERDGIQPSRPQIRQVPPPDDDD